MADQQRSWLPAKEMSDGNRSNATAIKERTPRGADAPMQAKTSSVSGPRTITIHRSSAGFGFTLRHFIVYPPDPISDCPEEWQRCMRAGLLDPAAPMDTIFVKHVRENGPAVQAGLATGDRVLSVNNEPVQGKSYAQVVQMIQRSGPALQLIVVPKEHDVLQQCFAETAHNPQSNIRTTATMVLSAPSTPVQTAACSLTSGSSSAEAARSNIMSHLPRPKPYQPFPVGHQGKSPPPPAQLAAATTPTCPVQGRSVVRVTIPIESSQAVPLLDSGLYDAQRSRSRASLAEYVPVPATTTTSAGKRSSYAGPATTRAEFIINVNSGGSPGLWSTSPRLDVQGCSPTPDSSLNASGDVSDSYGGPRSLNSRHGSSNSLAANRDSLTSSKTSLYSDVGDSVMTRIKKSFEQKEEFLKRPAASYWPSPEVQSPPVPREFYSHPQKFPRPPWPPQESDKTAAVGTVIDQQTPKTDRGTRLEVLTTPVVTSMEPWSMVFTSKRVTPPESPATPPVPYIGLVPNSVPRPFYGSTSPGQQQQQQPPHGAKNFVSTLTRIQENIPADCSNTQRKSDLELKLVCQPVQQAPLAEPEDFTPSPTKTAAPVSLPFIGGQSVPTKRDAVSVLLAETVSRRAKQFESGAIQSSTEVATPSPTKTDPNALGERGLLSRIAQRKQESEAKTKVPQRDANRPPGSGNRTVIFGGGKLHCEPPSDFKQLQFDPTQPLTENDSRKTVLRQNSYRSAVRSFNVSVDSLVGSPAFTSPLDKPEMPCTDGPNIARSKPKRPSRLTISIPDESNHGGDQQAPLSPTLSTPSPVTSDFQLSVLESFNEIMASLGSNSLQQEAVASAQPREEAAVEKNTPVETGVPPASKEPAVNKRPKIIYEDDAERGTRRVSYLKATAGDRLHVDSDVDVSDHDVENPSLTSTSCASSTTDVKRRNESRSHPHSINKLRSLFGEKSGVPHSSSGTSLTLPGTVIVKPADESTREGWLYVKQTLVENKRAADRSWKQLWAKNRNSSLYLYRDKKEAGSTSLGGEEHVVDLSASAVEIALDYTKRKHVLRLKMNNLGMEYLLQCEDNNDMLQWLQVLQEYTLNKDATQQNGVYSNSEMVLRKQAIELLENSSHGSKAIRKLTAFHQQHRSPTGHSPVSKTRKQSLGELPTSPNKPKTWKGKVVKQFKKIQGNSPSSPSQPQPPEGATFGVPLELCPRSSISENIPLIVELCVSIVEARGLETIGLYRVPGNTAAVTALTESLNKGLDSIDLQDPRWNDVNVISSLLKSFLRKLPEPLVTSESYSFFIEASRTEQEQQRAAAIKRIIQELPDINYETLRFLVRHLARVARYSHANKMEPRNLAIVFGPTLIRSGDDSTVTMVSDMSQQCRIVETLIEKADWFFPDDNLERIPSVHDLTDHSGQRKDINAKDIVAMIIQAASRKKEDDDSSSATPVPSSVSRPSNESSGTLTNTGSLQSLVDVASKGGIPALPSEAAAAVNYRYELPERKRSASLGGDLGLQPHRNDAGKIPSVSANPIDAAGIRSYCGLSAVTQERVRKFEQETKALLHRDLARQRKEVNSQKLDKGEVEKAWERAKYEMETEDFYDELADNPNDTVHKLLHRSADHVTMIPDADSSLAVAETLQQQSNSCPHLIDSVTDKQQPEDPARPSGPVVAGITNPKPEGPEEETDKPTEIAEESRAINTRDIEQPESRPTETDREVVPDIPKDQTKAELPNKTESAPKKSRDSEAKSPSSADKSSSESEPIKSVRSQIPRFSPAKTVRPSASASSSSASKIATPTSKIPAKKTSVVATETSARPARSSVSLGPQAGPSIPRPTSSVTRSIRTSIEVKAKPKIAKPLSKVPNGAENDPPEVQDPAGSSTMERKPSLRRSVEVTTREVKVKRSDSLTKDEKTESNTKARDRDRSLHNGRSRRVQNRTDCGLKRRHTVGGTRDFDKVRIHWLASSDNKGRGHSAWDRLQPLISDENLNVERNLKTWMKCERMRTSSPELCRRSEQAAVYPVLVVEN